MAGITTQKWRRVYADGCDISGFSRTIGPLSVVFDEVDVTADMSDTVRGYLRGRAQINLGTLNAVFDNTATTGLHTVMKTAGGARTVLVALGSLAAPAAGDAVFGGTFIQGAYTPLDDGGARGVSIPFTGWSGAAATLGYTNPWGLLLHTNSAATGANSANSGISNPTGGATTKGGFFLYQVTAGSGVDGTATLSVDDSADNSDWTALSGATSGLIDCSDNPAAAIVALGTGATVREYLRWQIVLPGGGATSVTAVWAFMRGF